MRKVFLITIVFSCIFSVFAVQTDEILFSTPKTIKSIAIQTSLDGNTKTAYFNVVEGFQDAGIATYSWGYVYINLANEAGRAMYAQLLAAKTNGSKIVRMVYSDGSTLGSGLRQLLLVEIQ
jgi:hypothetical protein